MKSDEKLAAYFFSKHPAAAARLLEAMDIPMAAEVLRTVPAPISALVMKQMLSTSSALCAEQLSAKTVARLIEELPVLMGASLLRNFKADVRGNVLHHVNPTRTAALRVLMRYPSSAVGAWMNPSVLTFPSDYSVSQAAELLEKGEFSQPRIYVVGRDRRPKGAVQGVDVLRGDKHGPIVALVEPTETIWARESVVSAQRREIWDTHSEAPVVNRQGEFVGSVTFADLRRSQRESQHDVSSDHTEESLGELTELFRHGLESACSSLVEIIRPDSNSRRGDGGERGV